MQAEDGALSDRPYKIVLDTNVIVASARSRRGASAAIVALVGTEKVELTLSAALALEYEEVLKRDEQRVAITAAEAEKLVAFLCANAQRHETIARPWPLSSDPDDEMVARLVVGSGCDYLVTHNVRHFRLLADLNVRVVTPREFLAIIKGEP